MHESEYLMHTDSLTQLKPNVDKYNNYCVEILCTLFDKTLGFTAKLFHDHMFVAFIGYALTDVTQ